MDQSIQVETCESKHPQITEMSLSVHHPSQHIGHQHGLMIKSVIIAQATKSNVDITQHRPELCAS